MSITRFGAARQVLQDAIKARVFPAAAVEVGTVDLVAWREAAGALTYGSGQPAATADTVFDLASLTKVIATTTLVLEAVAAGVIGLESPVAAWLPAWRGADRRQVTIRDLLLHSSGLPAWLPLYEQHAGREQFERAISAAPLAFEPGTRSVYSDPGFILLGFVLETCAGPLNAQFDAFCARLGIADLRFLPPAAWRPRIAPTREDGWRGRLLVGEVDDNNACALGGVSGHAGLFGTTAAAGAVARAWLRAAVGKAACGLRADVGLVQAFVTRGEVPSSSRALGWDTMAPASSCGSRMSRRAFGHTGFTGTSLWLDPERGIYAVLLTNRVHPDATDPEAILRVRRAFHDALAEGWSQ